MAKEAVVQIRMDAETKEEAENIYKTSEPLLRKR